MKKVILNAFAVIAMVLTASSCDKETMVQESDLPAKASTFVSENFSNATVSHVKKEKEGWSGKEYTVYLADGTEIEFDKSGNWTKVEGAQNNPIPTGFIPKSIVDYVAEKYPNTAINGIEKNKNSFDVELTNDLELVFDVNGNFLRID